MSHEVGLLAAAEAARVRALIARAGLPTRLEALDPRALREHMRLDKKVQDGQLRLVLLKRIGAAFLTADYPAAALEHTLAIHCGGAS